jgi:hypothetical protein
MSCSNPITAWRSKSGRNPETGKWPLTMSRNEGYSDTQMQVPCGQCIECRIERSRQWAIRCMHESSLYQENCFLTLTYDPEFVPVRKGQQTLWKADIRNFIKRLRFELGNEKVRYLQCGEYGQVCARCGKSHDQCTCGHYLPGIGRPHHHVCLFGFDFPDKQFYKLSKKGSKQFTSETLNRIWGFGFCTIGELNFESAAYVARYCTKVINGDMKKDHYQNRTPEYATMSRRPGIGQRWYEKYKNDLYGQGNDHCVIRNGVVVKPPKYYDKLKEMEEPDKYTVINGVMLGKELKEIDFIKRKRASSINPDEHTDKRICEKHKLTKIRFKNISDRNLESFKNDNSDFFST